MIPDKYLLYTNLSFFFFFFRNDTGVLSTTSQHTLTYPTQNNRYTTMSRKIHIAILDTDAPMPAVYTARGLYSSQFRVLLQAAAKRLNGFNFPPVSIHTTTYDVVGGSLPPLEYLRTTPVPAAVKFQNSNYDNDKQESSSSSSSSSTFSLGPGPIDAILITGSSASAYELDKYPWINTLQNFIQNVHTNYPHVKIFGSCFGHQIIAQALLGLSSNNNNNPHHILHVEPCPHGYEIGIHPITLNPDFVAHFAPSFPQLARMDSFRIQLVHGDRTVHRYSSYSPSSSSSSTATSSSSFSNLPLTLPHPWVSMGSTQLCPIQGLYLPGRVLTYQGHFEFDTFVNSETCSEFARRANWPVPFTEASLARINLAKSNSLSLSTAAGTAVAVDGDDDDSKLAAEMVVLFFADLVGNGAGCLGNENESTGGVENVVRANGMITPPLIVDA